MDCIDRNHTTRKETFRWSNFERQEVGKTISKLQIMGYLNGTGRTNQRAELRAQRVEPGAIENHSRKEWTQVLFKEIFHICLADIRISMKQ